MGSATGYFGEVGIGVFTCTECAAFWTVSRPKLFSDPSHKKLGVSDLGWYFFVFLVPISAFYQKLAWENGTVRVCPRIIIVSARGCLGDLRVTVGKLTWPRKVFVAKACVSSSNSNISEGFLGRWLQGWEEGVAPWVTSSLLGFDSF